MTVKKPTRCGGYAAIVARQRLHNTNQQLDIITITKPSSLPNYNIVVGFNEKDHLQLLTKEEFVRNVDDDKHKLAKEYTEVKTTKCENIPVDDITNCVNVENYPNCENTLVLYVTKNFVKEAIAIKFENDQDFKRIYFTYKYFKMRNRLTNNPTSFTSAGNLINKKKNFNERARNRMDSLNDFDFNKGRKIEFDLHTTENNGVTTISVLQKHNMKSRFDQPLSLIGLRTDGDGEVDSMIFSEGPVKSERKRLFQKNKSKTPISTAKDNKIVKGEHIKVNIERVPDVIPKDNKINKTPDLLMFKENVSKIRTSPTRNLWSTNNKASTGYESDREDWRSSRSQFSTTAFDSLSRPTKMAMALTLKKPQRMEPTPQYYRLAEPKKLPPVQMRPSFFQRPPRLPRPIADTTKRNQLSTEHRKFTSLQNLELPKKLCEPKKPESKRNYSNLSNKLSGITNKLRDLGATNTIGRFKAQSQNDVTNLKPVLKNVPDSKRSIVRTYSAEPPKKVTFSAYATVQVV